MRFPDELFMRRALELAAQGGVRTAPNPLVGAVVVKDGRVIGEGFHRVFGGPHAEVFALRAAGSKAAGATLYVTLEPCSPHPKKTPPCTDRIRKSGIRRVVVALRDPNPRVRGRGLALLRQAGIRVTTGVCAREAARMNAAYLKVRATGLPYLAVKWAMTLDGKIATRTGDSRWISSDRSRRRARRWRDTFHAILVGRGTVLRDDPLLRGARTRPTRIVLDSKARIPLGAKIVRTAKEQPTLLAVAPGASPSRLGRLRAAGVRILELAPRKLPRLLRELAALGLHRILVEGGGDVHASVLAEPGLADEACVFVAPKIVGGREAKTPVEGPGLALMGRAWTLAEVETERWGDDLVIRGRFRP